MLDVSTFGDHLLFGHNSVSLLCILSLCSLPIYLKIGLCIASEYLDSTKSRSESESED